MRTVMTASLGALGLVSAAVIAALLLFAVLLRQTTQTLHAVAEGLQAVDVIEDDLLSYGRARDAAIQTQLEGDLASLLEEARQHRAGPEVEESMERLSQAVSAYLAAYREARSQGLLPEQAAHRSAPQAGAAFAAARRYSATQIAAARRTQAQVSTWSSLAIVLGSLSALALLLLAGGGVLWIRKTAFRPVQGIGEAMAHFWAGDQASRAPLQGPAELQEISAHFNKLAEEMGRQQEAQMAFMGGIVHDLRNPLAVLQLAVSRLEHLPTPVAEDELHGSVALIRRQLDLLARITTDVLDASRVRAGHLVLQLRDRDLRELVEEAVEEVRATTHSHPIQVQLPEQPVPVRVDAGRISQVLHNLLSNAIKYSPAGREITVRLESQEEQALLSVRDQGQGIAPEDLPRLFKPFQRLGSAQASVPGEGLGLFITKKLVEGHGGRIEVEGRPGQGAEFRVCLPLAQPSEGRALEPGPPRQQPPFPRDGATP